MRTVLFTFTGAGLTTWTVPEDLQLQFAENTQGNLLLTDDVSFTVTTSFGVPAAKAGPFYALYVWLASGTSTGGILTGPLNLPLLGGSKVNVIASAAMSVVLYYEPAVVPAE